MRNQSSGTFYDHCAVLGLNTVGSLAELKAAYRPLILRWHPDRHHGSADQSTALELAKAINAAYEYLSEILEAGLAPNANQRANSSWRTTTDAYRTRRTYQKQTYHEGFPDLSVLEVFVKSSNLISAGYDSRKQILFLKFQGGGVYKYFEVPPIVYEELLAAESHGKFANANIFRQYRYEPC